MEAKLIFDQNPMLKSIQRSVRHVSWALLFPLTGCGRAPQTNTPPSALPTPVPPAPISILEPGRPVTLGSNGENNRYLRAGWSHPEPEFTWTEGDRAILTFRVPAPAGPLALEMTLAGLTKTPVLPAQPVTVKVNGEALADWQVGDRAAFRAVIPARLVPADGVVNVEFGLPKAATPAELGLGADPRRLAVQAFSFQVTTPSGPAAAPVVGRRYELGSVVLFGENREGSRYQLSGWQPAEPEFAWTTGQAALTFELPINTRGPLNLRVRLTGLIKPPELPAQLTEVFANGTKVADWQVGDTADFHAVLPAEVAGANGGVINLEFRVPRAATPQSLGLGNDPRTLGVRCHELVMEAATAN